MNLRTNVLTHVLSLLALLALWQVSASLAQDRVLPSPAAVVQSMSAGFQDGELPYSIGVRP